MSATEGPDLAHATFIASPRAALCVLGSGSGGNCSVLTFSTAAGRRAWLIDAGFSPKRTRFMLDTVGVREDQLAGILLTHTDHDHFHPGWGSALGPHIPVYAHPHHAADVRAAAARGACGTRIEYLDAPIQLDPDLTVRTTLMAHDELGVAAMRFDVADGSSLGFATDLGRVTDQFVRHLAGVDVLAIESNYCPELQKNSSRPAFLKQRIMDGHGHLSNHQAADAVDRIQPAEHVVFLHLSRECNRPQLVADLHEGADYACTISSQDAPTRWVPVRPCSPRRAPEPVITARQAALFS